MGNITSDDCTDAVDLIPESPRSNSCIIKPYETWSNSDPPYLLGINGPKQPNSPNFGNKFFGKTHDWQASSIIGDISRLTKLLIVFRI